MRNKRLDGRDEQILEPDLAIVDSHFHLFDRPGNRYMLEEYLADASAGHKIVASIYCETQAFIRADGPEVLQPLGEVEFANGVAAMAASGIYGPCKVAHGIIGNANLTHGSKVGELLDRCMQVAPDRFRAVRQIIMDYPDERPYKYFMSGRPPMGVMDTEGFPLGLAEIEKRDLVFDAAVFDPFLPRLADVVDRFPNLRFVLNHMGTAVGIDMTVEQKAEVFRTWRAALQDIARRPNVYCKVGGMGMPHWGFEFELRDEVTPSSVFAEAWRPYIETAIEAFGAERCMMESNFPPDSRSGGFVPIWNAYKLITRDASDDEKALLYRETAMRVYRLEHY
jgi:predicted TIM-barrel fold metal-dependent hydrolase